MSSLRTIYNRKRRSDDECSSSDSDEDAQPVKKLCVLNREPSTLPKYLLYVKDTFAEKISNFCNWLWKLPLGSNNNRAKMLKCSLDGHIPIEVEEEEEDIDIVEINTEDEDLIIEEEFTQISDKSTREDNLPRNSIPIPVFTHPVSSSTPVYRGQNGTRGRTFNSLSRQPVNGCNNSTTYPTRNKRNSTIVQKLKNNRNFAPITNPSLDVEILLDTKEAPGDESDDLEIVSEISNERSSKKLTRQIILPVPKCGQASKEYNGISPGSIMNGKATSYERPRSLNKSSTAFDVIRLQEKQHYQLILDKMVNAPTYHPVIPKKNPKPAEIRVDLTEDDNPVVLSHFKREVLEKPVNEFLQKYYKPCKFKPCASPKDNSEVEIFTVDDVVQVIEAETSAGDYFTYTPKVVKKTGFFSSAWLEEFKDSIIFETNCKLNSIEKQQQKVEKIKNRGKSKNVRDKILRGQSISSDQSEKDEFPELTPDMDDRIEWAFTPILPVLETLSTFKDCTCNRSDIMTLSNLNWLNDSVINFYLALVMERGKNHPIYPSVYAFNSYFYSSLKSRGPKAVMRWTRKIEDGKNIFQFDILFVPLHLGVHWALCVVDNRTKKIKYYDSMQGTDDQCLRILQKYLVVEKQEKLRIAMDLNAYSLEIVKDIPQQMNGSDCGMFTLKYAEYISRDAPITFSQEHMQYFRRRMVIEILEKRLF